METILVLAHTETDGSLAKSAREALHAAATLHKSLAGSKLVVGLIGENVQSAANSIAACPATKYFGVTGAEFSHRCGGGGSRLQGRRRDNCRRSGDFALGARAARRRATAWRARGHARHRRCRGGRENFHQPLVLQAADGRRFHAGAAAVVYRR
jgi:hypothetical protein